MPTRGLLEDGKRSPKVRTRRVADIGTSELAFYTHVTTSRDAASNSKVSTLLVLAFARQSLPSSFQPFLRDVMSHLLGRLVPGWGRGRGRNARSKNGRGAKEVYTSAEDVKTFRKNRKKDPRLRSRLDLVMRAVLVFSHHAPSVSGSVLIQRQENRHRNPVVGPTAPLLPRTSVTANRFSSSHPYGGASG